MLVAGYTLPLVWRRVVPGPAAFASLILILTLAVADASGRQPTIPIVIALAGFTLGSGLRSPYDWSALLAACGLCAIAEVATGGITADTAFLALLLGAPWLFGRALRSRAAHADELEARARRAEGERAARDQAAAAAERIRLARELHDVVAHSISVIALQTQAVRRRLGSGHEREIADLQAVETTARQAMGEMRRLFGVLRDDGAALPLAPQPGLDQLPLLVERTAAAGLPVDLQVEGEPRDVPPGVDLAAYRIVQEALTNAVRHAGPAHAAVTVAYRPYNVDLVVEDDGVGPAVPGPRGGGHGLRGMRERVALYGGRLDLGPRPGGGWRVHASLPFTEGVGA